MATSVTSPDGAALGGAVRRQRYGVLLGALIASFLLQGMVPPSAWAEVLSSALLGATLLLALRAGEVKPWLVRLAAAVVAVTVIVAVAQAVGSQVSDGVARLSNALLVALAPPAVVVGVVRSLRAHRRVPVEAALGVLCLYLLLGMFYAQLYGAIDRLGGHPFFADGAMATVSRCQYFSFATLTTVGYGDLAARTDVGHTLAVSEALLGQIYLVTVVAVIVGNLGRPHAGLRG